MKCSLKMTYQANLLTVEEPCKGDARFKCLWDQSSQRITLLQFFVTNIDTFGSYQWYLSAAIWVG